MRFIVAIVIFLLGCPAAYAQDAPACSGNNLLEQLRLKESTKYEAVMAKAKAIPNGEAILWKIERDGMTPSHLLGTAHVTDQRITKGPEGLEALIAGASKVVLEIAELGDAQAMAAAAMRNAPLMVMPPGESLWDLVPDEYESLIRESPNLPEGAAGSLYGYRPWVVSMMLAVPLCEQAREASGLKSFDELIAGYAIRQGVEVVGLETVEEQFKTLSGMDMATQVTFLIETAKNGHRTADDFETLLALYESRQITAMMPLMEMIEPQTEASRKIMAYMENDLLIKRNHIMAERAQPLIDKGSAVIAIGALHLPGTEGVVELLRKAGYKVTPVN